ncbi:putative ribonuclease H-like domain-containing protein [Tanacetum coccineum]
MLPVHSHNPKVTNTIVPEKVTKPRIHIRNDGIDTHDYSLLNSNKLKDYALWEVIEYGNSFKPVPRTTTNADGTSTTTMTDAKSLFEAIKARFSGNAATKKTQKTLLKQMYEKFNASGTKSLDSIFNRLQKIVSQLAVLGETISQEDLNLKFLRSFPAEWNTHVVVWKNKPDIEAMSFDDLYNNFKIVEQEIKRTFRTSSNSSSQNVAFVSTPSSTSDVNTASVPVSTASTPVSIVSTNNSTTTLSDATVYAFLANQPKGSPVVHEDLEQIHDDDLEEMDLKWQLALLRFDKSKVECFNYHKLGHFARECRNQNSQENRSRSYDSRDRNQESSKRTVNIKEITPKAMVAVDGTGFDWSFMADEEVPTNMALMAFSYSEVLNDKSYSNSCLKSFENLKTQYDNLRVELNKTEFELATYKRGLASVEEQLVFYKKNKVAFYDQIAILKRDASFKDSEINALNIQLEKLKIEKESNQIKINQFENASKSLDKLIESQLTNNHKKGVGFDNYNAVAPPPICLFAPPSIDLSNTGLKEFQLPEFEGYGAKVKKSACENSSKEIKKTTGAPIIEDWVSDSNEDESKVIVFDNKPEQVKQPGIVNENSRNKRTNWNEKKTQKLGVGVQFTKNACFVCGSFSHLIKDYNFHDKRMVQKLVMNNGQRGIGQRKARPVWNNAMRSNHQNFSKSRRIFSPTVVLTKSSIVPISTARYSSPRAATPVSTARPSNTAAPKSFVNVAKPKPNVSQKSHSPSRRLFNQQTTLKNRILNNKVYTAKVNSVNTTKENKVTSAIGEQGINVVKSSTCWVWRPKRNVIDHISKNSGSYICDPQVALKDTGIFDSGCSRHMTGNKSYLTDYQDYDGGCVAFAGSSKGGKIIGKGKIRTGKLDLEDVYFVKELKFNLFSVSHMCDMKNSVLFTKTECLILSPDFKLPDENQVMLKIPRKDNMYSFDIKNIVLSKGLTCLIAKATNDESKMWHRRLGHINFKTMNKLVKGNLVRGLPSKIFENDHTCVVCQKGKQHKASCKTKLVNSISQPLQILHMDLFGPTFVKSIMGKMYCLVVTDDYSRSDNGTEFKNYEMNQFCGIKGIKREFSNARTPQQNGVAERKNRTLIEAARTMLADSLLPIQFWAEAINTACYVQNRVLVTKPHNKTPYELLIGRTPILSFMRPFGCPVTILNPLDYLGKFDGKANEGFLVGYSINSKAFRVFNNRTRKVEENLHVNFLENKPNVAGSLEANFDAGQAGKENVPNQEYILLPLLHISSNIPLNSEKDESSPKDDTRKINNVKDLAKEGDMNGPGEATHTNNKNDNNATSPFNTDYSVDPFMSNLDDFYNLQNTGIFNNAYDDEDVGVEADINNLETTMSVSPIPIARIHKDHPKNQIIGEMQSSVQTRKMAKQNEEALIAFINKQRRINHKDFQNCLFAFFLSQMEPKKITQALDDESWVEAMQEELLQFKLLNVWKLVDLPLGKKAIGHRQEEGIDYDEVFAPVAKIEAIRLFLAFSSYMNFIVYQMDVKSAFLYGTIEEEVYVNQPPGFVDPEFPNRVYKVEKALYGLHQAPRAWYETLSSYLLENGFRRGTIDKTLFIKKIKNDILLVQVYVDDIIFGSTQKSLSTEFKQLMHRRFQMSSMGELTLFLGLQVEQRKDGIFLSQDKYINDILKKFGFSNVKTAKTPMETHKPLVKDEKNTDVDVHLYRSMIGSLMYLTSSRPDIMFAVCACSRFKVQPKASHMHAVKRIFRYLKGQPTLGLWYPKDSPLDLIAYSNSDYTGASLDRKSKTGGCQFLGCRLILWQCKKQSFVANSTTEAEYIVASNCCGQVLVFDCKHWYAQSLKHGLRGGQNTKVPQSGGPPNKVGDEAVHKESSDRMERAATTASGLEAEHDSGNTN